MKRTTVTIGFLLLIGNLIGVAWLLFLNRSQGEPATLTENQLVQLDKLFEVVTNFHNEFGNAVGQAAYPDDSKKNDAKNLFRLHSIAYQAARLDFLEARRKRSVEALSHFLSSDIIQTQWGYGQLMEIPKYIFQTYEMPKYDQNMQRVQEGKTVTFANLSKLESLHDEFLVLAESMIKDIK